MVVFPSYHIDYTGEQFATFFVDLDFLTDFDLTVYADYESEISFLLSRQILCLSMSMMLKLVPALIVISLLKMIVFVRDLIRMRIVIWHMIQDSQKSFRNRKIAKIINCSKGTVLKYLKNPVGYGQKASPGRPSTVTNCKGELSFVPHAIQRSPPEHYVKRVV